MPLLQRRDVLLAGALDVLLLTSWPWEKNAYFMGSKFNMCALLSVVAIPCALFDFILLHTARNKGGLKWSLWEHTSFARHAIITIVYFDAAFAGACACAAASVYAFYTLALHRSPPAAHLVRLAHRCMYTVFCVVMSVVLLVQRQGIYIAVPLALTYLPQRAEPWARILVGFWWFYWHCLMVSIHANTLLSRPNR